MLEGGMPAEIIPEKYGYVKVGIPMAILYTADGVAAEINPLANFLCKIGVELPDNYKDIAVSPVKTIPGPQGWQIVPSDADTKQLEEWVEEINEVEIPKFQLEQQRIGQLMAFNDSNFALGAAIRGASYTESLQLYLDEQADMKKKLELNAEPVQLQISSLLED
jgi:hypothetical protein